MEEVGFENMCGCVKVNFDFWVFGYDNVFIFGDSLFFINEEMEWLYLLIV